MAVLAKPRPTAFRTLIAALKDALVSAVLALGLAVPILAITLVFLPSGLLGRPEVEKV